MGNAYQIDRLSLSIEGKPILKNVSFALPEGASLAIVGPNGAGKTTLLKCLLRLCATYRGEVSLFGKELRRYGRRDLARIAAYVPQAGVEPTPFTVEEFILLARYPYLSPFSHVTQSDREIAREAMEQSDVAHFAQRLMHTLSGGERQKVHIAAALTQQPRVMLLDEATAFLDYRHQVEVLELVAKLRREKGLTVIAVTHDLNQGVLHYDSVLALKKGETAFMGTPHELLEPGRLESIYGVSFERIQGEDGQPRYVFPMRGII